MADQPVRHILSLSGGKDSAALAIYMRDRVPDMEYIFHDTDKELPETYEYLARLEAILGKRIAKTTADQNFDHWLTVFGGMIPSNHRRWCTKVLKLKPFERYVGDSTVINYVAIRADEKREGYISHKPNIKTVYPFREDGLVKADVLRILEESGLGLPRYTEWGRTRSGCSLLGGSEQQWGGDYVYYTLDMKGIHGPLTIHVIRDLTALPPHDDKGRYADKAELLTKFCDCLCEMDGKVQFLIAANDGQLVETLQRLPATANVTKVRSLVESLLVEGQRESAEALRTGAGSALPHAAPARTRQHVGGSVQL